MGLSGGLEKGCDDPVERRHHLVHRVVDGQVYALKKVKMGKLSDKEKENALNEVRILASIKHSNICAYHEAFIDEPSSSLW